MYSTLQLVTNYFRFYASASNSKGHGMHSPFVYQFIREVLQDHTAYEDYRQWEKWRSTLRSTKDKLLMQEMGAGSRSGVHSYRTVSSLVKTSSKPPRIAKLLFRIARYYQPDCIIELGTSLGLSTALFSLARPTAAIYTLEGMPSLATRAVAQFSEWGLSNISVVQGSFDDQMLPLLEKNVSPQLVFIDGNHRKEPTIRYFNWLMEKVHPTAVLIFDDIHWSAEMEEAWETIKADSRVRCSVDLFHIGIIFLREEFLVPRHFRIRY